VRAWEPFTVAWRENVLRYFAPFDHEDPAWSYLVRVFDLFAPWSLLLPIALARTLPALWRRTARVPEALVFALATFAFFTLAGSRRPYYLLPILPFLACLVADVLCDWSAGALARLEERWVSGVFVVLGGALIAALVVYVAVLPFAGRLPVDPRGLGWAALGCAIVGVAVLWSVRHGSARGLAGALVGVWLVYTACVVPFAAAHSQLRDDAALLRELHRPCGLLATEDTDLQFYIDASCADLTDEASALRWARDSGGFVVTVVPLTDPAWHEALRTKSWRAVVAADVPPLASTP
jgi:4-amino-4-deoxy-L-arabinose transferase-like glycosyltransferase